MFQTIRESKWVKIITIFIAYMIIIDPISRSVYALTSGPSQPEFAGISGGGTDNLVDPFTGNFTYGIPLFDVNGQSVMLSYDSEVSMDQEASWVGLGWNLNTGAITRSMRGLPDDFSGDMVEEEHNVKTMKIINFNVKLKPELFAIESEKLLKMIKNASLSGGLNYTYNNYRGWSINPNFGITELATSVPFNFGVNVNATEKGMVVTPNIGLPELARSTFNVFDLNTGISFNSNEGLKSLSFSLSSMSSRATESLDFNTVTYNPTAEYPYYNFTQTRNVGIGVNTNFFSGFIMSGGSYSEQGLMFQRRSIPAFGYLNSQNAGSSDQVLLDFNREKDGVITDNTTILPITNQTYDVFSVSGFGMNGSFRAHRNDVGCIYDCQVQNFGNSEWKGVPFKNTDVSSGVEAGAGNLVDVGVNLDISNTKIKTGGKGSLVSNYSYKNFKQDDLREPYYFKMSGELSYSPSAENTYDALNGKTPLAFKFNSVPKISVKLPSLEDKLSYGQSSFVTNSKPYYSKRQNRSTMIQALTIAEANKYYPEFFKENKYANGNTHHIGMIIITAPDGTRYIYGETVYNVEQEDVTFNTGENLNSPEDGWVDYNQKNASIENEKGIDNYYKKTKTPAYAHTFLLTAILSHDYADASKNGPTFDDYGNWTLFKYEKKLDVDGDNYKWRTPYFGTPGRANFIEGEKHRTADNKGTYSYGVRELKYLKTISTRSQEIVYHTSTREDGCGVEDAMGEMDETNNQYKLDSIQVFVNGLDASGNTSKELVKTVCFEYDYSLCKNVPNNTTDTVMDGPTDLNTNHGKLTLKKVYFKSGKSQKGEDRPYAFTYSSTNPSYHMKAYNRWGTYKPVVANQISNADYPYVEQNSTEQTNIQAWKLVDIDLPTGGKIEVEYESDEYGWVQNRPAAQMFKVLNATTGVPTINDISPSSDPTLRGNFYLLIELSDPLDGGLSGSAANTYFRENYLAREGEDPDKKLQDNFYFRFRTNINKDTDADDDDFAFVSGFAEIDISNCGAIYNSTSNKYTHAYIKLKSVPVNEDGSVFSEPANPISKAAWQYARLNADEYVYDREVLDGNNDGWETLVQSVKRMMTLSYLKMYFNVDKRLLQKGYGKFFKNDESWVRLFNPTGRKLGGGARVKSITTINNWDLMTSSENPSAYRTVYSYDLEDGTCSGVASWEPGFGADENPFRLPAWNKSDDIFINRALCPDERYYQELPIGESFMPRATVGYSMVTIKQVPLKYTTSGFAIVQNMASHKTGKIVKEFYTAKDFPTKTEVTDLSFQNSKNNIAAVFYNHREENAVATQGFTIRLNDMHGKPKSEFIYAEDKDDSKEEAISGKEYCYKHKYSSLESDVLFADKTGEVEEGKMGLDIDMAVDYRYYESKMLSGGLNANAELTLPGIPFLFGLYNINKQKVSFECATTTKVINQKAILEEIKVFDLGAKISTKNVVYDKVTGQVILNETINEYNDKLYTLTYPAYWAYKGMDEAYKLSGFNCKGSWIATNTSLITEGDVVWIDGVMYTYADVNGTLKYVDQYGATLSVSSLTSSNNCVIVRPGNRNILNASAGSIISKTNPLVDNDPGPDFDYELEIDNENIEVVNANATQYNPKWRNHFYPECAPATTVHNFRAVSGPDAAGNKYATAAIIDALERVLPKHPGSSQALEVEMGNDHFLSNYNYINCYACENNIAANGVISATNPLYGWAPYINDLLDIVDSTTSTTQSVYVSGWTWTPQGKYAQIPNGDELIWDPNYPNRITVIDNKTGHHLTEKLEFFKYDGFEKHRLNLSSSRALYLLSSIDEDLTFYKCQGQKIEYVMGGGKKPRAWMDAEFVSPLSEDLIVVEYTPYSSKTNLNLFYFYQSAMWPKTYSNGEVTSLKYSVELDQNLTNDGTEFNLIINMKHPTESSPTNVLRTQKVKGVVLQSKTLNYSDIDFIKGNFSVEGSTLPFAYTSGDVILEVHTKSGDIRYVKLTVPSTGDKIENSDYFCSSPNPCYTIKQNYSTTTITSDTKPLHEYTLSWSPTTSYSYKDDRTRTVIAGVDNSTNIQVDGVYNVSSTNKYKPFWTFASTTDDYLTANATNWVWTKGVSEKNPYGVEIEEVNALGVYSSAYLDWTKTKPIAVAQNARIEQIFNDNFEEYSAQNICVLAYPKCFINNVLQRTTTYAHSGLYSMEVYADSNISMAINDQNIDAPVVSSSFNANTLYENSKEYIDQSITYDLEHIQYFAPYKNVSYAQEFLCSFWVRNDDLRETISFFKNNVNLDVSVGTANPNVIYTYGPMVEGWCKVEARFTVAAYSSGIFSITVKNNSSTKNIFVDDIRVHPPDAMMKSYVYNRTNGLLMAEMDENNFATFYEYDEELNMVRIKRETERGIMTIKESRRHYRR